jgi:hypothetical protein
VRFVDLSVIAKRSVALVVAIIGPSQAAVAVVALVIYEETVAQPLAASSIAGTIRPTPAFIANGFYGSAFLEIYNLRPAFAAW